MSKIKAITIQYELIEMFQSTSTWGVHTGGSKKHTYPDGNKTAFDCTRFGM